MPIAKKSKRHTVRFKAGKELIKRRGRKAVKKRSRTKVKEAIHRLR